MRSREDASGRKSRMNSAMFTVLKFSLNEIALMKVRHLILTGNFRIMSHI